MTVEQLHEKTKKKVFELYPNYKNIPLGPKKSKMTPTLCQKQMPGLKET